MDAILPDVPPTAADNIGELYNSLVDIRAKMECILQCPDNLNVLAVPVFTEYFQSLEQAITASGSIVLEHGLTKEPKLIQLAIICKTAEHGWAVGDIVYISPHVHSTSAADNYGIAVMVNKVTEINIIFASNATTIRSIRKDTSTGIALTNANWKLIIKAWA